LSAMTAHADVLNFDDLPGLNFFTSNYNGFTFGDNLIATNPWFWTNSTTPFYVPNSGTGMVATDFQLYNNTNPFEATQPIYNPTPFQFQGAYFTGGDPDRIRYQLYTGVQTTPGSLNGLTLVYTSPDSAVLSSTPTFVSNAYTGFITAVVIVSRQGFYAMDDFTYAPVPEPATYGMLLAGLAAVGAVARRRKQA
jgi:hypothetical protein